MSTAGAFAASVAAIELRIAHERADSALDPRCTPVLLHHGHPTERAIVLFHGFTNCPRQFAQFAGLLFDNGYNVYVPRLPRHGMLDKLTTQLEALTIDELTNCASDALCEATVLGSKPSALGLSVGATMVAWLAQTHIFEHAVAIAPFFSVARVPSQLEPVLARALAFAPDIEMWWDPRLKERIGPAHGYPRFPTHALARCLELGESVRARARRAAPLAVRSTLVLNAKDPAVDGAAARDVWKIWRDRGAAADEYVFENLDARHDIIEPETYADAARLVYPVLLALIASGV